MNKTKYRLFISFSLALALFISSCSEDEEVTPVENELNIFQTEVVSYFKAVALGFENGGSTEITRKWRSPMRIFIYGSPSDQLIEKVEQTVEDINKLASDGFSVEIVDDANLSNCPLFFGKEADFVEAFPDAQGQIGTNLAIFNVWWNNNIINRARIFIDTERTNLTQQKSLILEEITQSLGLGKDSPRYPGSIFYETPTDGGFATEYSDLDRELVRLLYHPAMSVGLNERGVDVVLRNILLSE